MTGYGDERAGEFPGQPLHEPGFAAAGRAFEQDWQAVVVRGSGDVQFFRLFQVEWFSGNDMSLGGDVFHVFSPSLMKGK